MARVSDVHDEAIRGLLERARQEIRAGKPPAAVHTCVEAFMALFALHPDELRPLAAPDALRAAPTTLHWPDYGTHLTLDAETQQPSVVFDRERFSLSEAITYLEFVLARAVALGA